MSRLGTWADVDDLDASLPAPQQANRGVERTAGGRSSVVADDYVQAYGRRRIRGRVSWLRVLSVMSPP